MAWTRALISLWILFLLSACTAAGGPTAVPNATMTAVYQPSATADLEPTQTEAAQPQTAETPLVLAVTEAVNPTAAPTQAPPQRDGWTAAYFSTRPEVDGDLAEWSGFTPAALALLLEGRENWEGPLDLSAAVQVGWDYQNLYVGIKIKDDVYRQNGSGEDWQVWDALLVCMDTDLRGDFDSPQRNVDDVQLWLTAGAPKVGENLGVYQTAPANLRGLRQEAALFAWAYPSDSERGYILEAALPWEVLGVQPQAGDEFGFAVVISDNDSDQAARQSLVGGVYGWKAADPTTWGALRLGQ